MQDNGDSGLFGEPLVEPEPPQPSQGPTPPTPSTLSTEQIERMRQNRLRALERKKQRESGSLIFCLFFTSPLRGNVMFRMKTSFARNY